MSEITLYNEDCFERMKQLSDNSIDLILTDPPYLFNRGGGTNEGTDKNAIGGKSDLYKFGNKMMGDMASFDKDKIYKLLNESKRLCKIMRGYYFCNETALSYYLQWANENNCKYNIIVLEKSAFIMNRNKYATNCEYLIRIIAKSGAGLKILDYDKSENDISWLYSVQQFDKIQNKLHPTEKPLNILNGVIQLNTDEDDLVFDPFMGSGSCGVVCAMMNRNFIGIEIDDKYFKIAENRIKESKTSIFEI